MRRTTIQFFLNDLEALLMLGKLKDSNVFLITKDFLSIRVEIIVTSIHQMLLDIVKNCVTTRNTF